MIPHGKFVIYVKPPRQKHFGELSYYEFDDAKKAKDERRLGALERVASSVTGWATRYAKYKDAGFQVREVTPADNGKYGSRKGTVIDVFKEIDKAKTSRLVFDMLIAAERRQADEDAARAKLKAERKAAIARGETPPSLPPVKKPDKPAKTKSTRSPKQPKAEGELTRRDIRRAAKRACIAKEGSKDNWRNYL
jgi:hypothetical protein